MLGFRKAAATALTATGELEPPKLGGCEGNGAEEVREWG